MGLIGNLFLWPTPIRLWVFGPIRIIILIIWMKMNSNPIASIADSLFSVVVGNPKLSRYYSSTIPFLVFFWLCASVALTFLSLSVRLFVAGWESGSISAPKTTIVAIKATWIRSALVSLAVKTKLKNIHWGFIFFFFFFPQQNGKLPQPSSNKKRGVLERKRKRGEIIVNLAY